MRARAMVAACLLLVAAALPARAGTMVLVPSVDAPAGPEGVPRLSGETDRLELRFAVPAAPGDGRAELLIPMRTGIDVLPESSRIELLLDGRPLADAPATLTDGFGRVRVTFPADWLAPGGNVLTARARHAHRVGCAPEAVDELWTEIDPRRTELRVPTAGAGGGVDVDALLAGPGPLTVIRPPRGDAARFLTRAAAVAQGYGRRIAPRAAEFEIRTPEAGATPLDGAGALGKVVVAGSAAELAGIVAPDVLDEAVRRGTAIRANPTSGRILLVFSGFDAAAADAAVEAFRAGAPAGSSLPAFTGPGALTLFDLGHRMSADNVLRRRVEASFRMPDDFLAEGGGRVELTLNLAHDSTLGAGARVAAKINGRWVGEVRLDRGASRVIEGARLTAPLDVLRPGRNDLLIEAALPADPASGCENGVPRAAGDDGMPRFTLFDDSTLRVTDFERLHVLPNLGLTAGSGFPYRREREPSVLVVPDPSSQAIAAALRLVARVGRSAPEAPRIEARVEFGGLEGRDALVVAPVSALERHHLATASFGRDALADALTRGPALAEEEARLAARLRDLRRNAVRDSAELPAPAAPPATRELKRMWRERIDGAAEGAAHEPETDSWATRALRGAWDEIDGLVRRSSVGVGLRDGGVRAVFMQYQSPVSAGRTWTVLTARDGKGLESAAARVTGKLWPRLRGAALVLENDGDARFVDAAEPYHQWRGWSRPGAWRQVVRQWAGQNILVFVAGIVGLLAALAAAARWVIVRSRARRVV